MKHGKKKGKGYKVPMLQGRRYMMFSLYLAGDKKGRGGPPRAGTNTHQNKQRLGEADPRGKGGRGHRKVATKTDIPKKLKN